ncbi:AAA family ATPase [Roseovarius aestuarii]|uniref:Shikimate kinase n=1 Tax=Roseovarius aestuarii TaxID=475083 RepID=A0A1X7BMI0_9RHOB|nr:hypothetical protein [Roseovarius aestuarii]SMC10817.1 hypothetical protein ROA7745_00624 [Roseovarius aestuarii]
MKLFLIHGAPATGKLTVGRALSSLTGLPLVDNHAAIDIARMVFGFAKPGFWDLVHDLRVATLHGAARANILELITTAAYSKPEDDPLVQDYERAIEEFGGTIEPIHLYCSKETLMARVSASERQKRGKLATPEDLKTYLDRYNFVAMPRDNCLSLSTENASASQTASIIAKHFQISTAHGP